MKGIVLGISGEMNCLTNYAYLKCIFCGKAVNKEQLYLVDILMICLNCTHFYTPV